MPKKILMPLWAKIVLLATLNLAVLTAVFVGFLRSELQPFFVPIATALARDEVIELATHLAADLPTRTPDKWDHLLDDASTSNGVRVLLYRITGEQLAGPRIDLYPGIEELIRRQQPGAPADSPSLQFVEVAPTDPKYWIGVRMPEIRLQDGNNIRAVMVIASDSFVESDFFFEYKPWLATGMMALAISALCWLPLLRNVTRSIGEATQAAGHVAEGRFDVDVRTDRRDELGSLGTSIKQMAGRLKLLTEGRQRFLNAVAHELRSPIARMQLATEILERDAPEANQKHLGYLREDLQTMSQLTDELLQLARADSPLEPVKVQPTNIAEAVGTAVRREKVEGADVRVTVDSSIQAQAHMEYLARAVSNALRNAIHYARDLGPIFISAARNNHQVVVSIRDSGPGVPKDALEKIFSPFYRIDDARDRRTGGTGLGLAIVRNCIEACGGTVECRNSNPGLEVVITLRAA